MAKIFPTNFLNRGGGYFPDKDVTSKLATTEYRADDLLFGRACFVPATMIPWTHRPQSDIGRQRLRRLQAQHFLFLAEHVAGCYRYGQPVAQTQTRSMKNDQVQYSLLGMFLIPDQKKKDSHTPAPFLETLTLKGV